MTSVIYILYIEETRKELAQAHWDQSELQFETTVEFQLMLLTSNQRVLDISCHSM